MANEDLLKAINAAIEEPPSEADDDADETELDGDSAGDEGTDEAGDDADGESGTEDANGDGAEGEEEVPGEDAGADDKAPVLDKDGKPVVDAAGKAAADAAAAAAKPKDLLNDPVDPRLKESTRERITGLIDIAKRATERATAVEGQFNEVMGYIQEAKATPEQYGQALEYIGMVNSQDPAKMEAAWNFMMGEMQALGRMLGKDVPGMDYLGAHPDLKAAVAAGQVTEAVAKETARLRDAQNHQNQMQQHTRQVQQTNEQRAAVLQQGRDTLNALGNQLKTANPAEYAAKSKILTAALKGTFAQLDPRQWAAAYKRAYDELKLPAAARVVPPVARKSNVPQNQPLRGKQPAGGTQAAPKSLRDAIDMGINEGSR